MNVEGGAMTRTFVAGAARFAVRCPDESIRTVVESLLSDLCTTDDPAERVIWLDRVAEGIEVRVDEGHEYIAQPPDAALSTLLTLITRVALDAEPDRLHLHAAAVARAGRGVLISAASGSGKTTLAAALVQQGWSYVSDESVAVDPESLRCHGFPKPLTIKPGMATPLPQLVAHRIQIDPAEYDWWLVPAGAASQDIAAWVKPELIIILYRSADGSFDDPPTLTELHPSEAVVALMQQTMDAQRFGTRSLEVLARLVASARCVALRNGPLDATVAEISGLIGGTPPTAAVRLLERRHPEDNAWSVPEPVRSVVVDDRVVAHDTEDGAIVALDAAGSAVWLAIHGEPPSWWTSEVMHSQATQMFLSDLAAHGLLARRSENHG